MKPETKEENDCRGVIRVVHRPCGLVFRWYRMIVKSWGGKRMLKLQTWMVILVSGLLGFAVSAGAAEKSTPEYSADSTMETADAVMSGAVYVAPGKERRENVMDGEKSVMIIRHDKNVVWMLMPADKMYTEMKPGQSGGRKDDLSAYKIDQTTVGPDSVNGIQATKSKIIMTGPKGDKLGGFWWTTRS